MDRWGDYPLNLPGSSVLPGSGAGLRVQMDQMEDDLFSDEIRVRVRDIHRDSKSTSDGSDRA